MKISKVLPIVSLIIFPIIGLAQTSTTQVSPIQSATTVTSSQTTTTATSPNIKCGVINLKVCNECGLGVYKNVHVQCSDGSEITLGEATSCKPVDLWNQYAKEACANHCSSGGWGGWSDFTSTPVACTEYVSPKPSSQPIEVPTPIIYAGETTEGGNAYLPINPSTVPIVEREWVSVCTTIDTLAQNYKDAVLELQKQEALSDRGGIEYMTRSIETLKNILKM